MKWKFDIKRNIKIGYSINSDYVHIESNDKDTQEFLQMLGTCIYKKSFLNQIIRNYIKYQYSCIFYLNIDKFKPIIVTLIKPYIDKIVNDINDCSVFQKNINATRLIFLSADTTSQIQLAQLMPENIRRQLVFRGLSIVSFDKEFFHNDFIEIFKVMRQQQILYNNFDYSISKIIKAQNFSFDEILNFPELLDCILSMTNFNYLHFLPEQINTLEILSKV